MLNKSNLLFILILLGLGLVFASGWHLADEIFPGTFAPGVYSFNGSQVDYGNAIVNFTDATVIGVGGSLQLSDSITVCNLDNDGVLILNKTTREILICNGEEWEIFKQIGPFKNYWGDGSDGNISVRSDGIYQDLGSGYVQIYSTQQWPNVEDGDMVVINAQNFEVQSGVTFTTANRSRGLLIYSTGVFNNSGTISMSQRGARANPDDSGVNTYTPVAPSDGNAVPDEGLVIRRHKSTWSDIDATVISNARASDVTNFQGSHDSEDLFYGTGIEAVSGEDMQQPVTEGLVIKLPKVGGSGGIGRTSPPADSGSTAMFSTGGGGGGGYSTAGNCGGNGAAGSLFSGGPGAGGQYNECGGDGTPYGGRGGLGGDIGGSGGSGAGNPGGTTGNVGQDGTGGLLLVFGKNIVGSGSLTSQGSNGGNAPSGGAGGGSGGGIIGIFYVTSSATYSIGVGGGSAGSGANPGGNGGAGVVIGPIKIDE